MHNKTIPPGAGKLFLSYARNDDQSFVAKLNEVLAVDQAGIDATLTQAIETLDARWSRQTDTWDPSVLKPGENHET